MADAEVLELDGREVRLSSPGKVLFAERGETKRDLVEHYVPRRRAAAAPDGGAAGAHAALPPGRRRAVVLPEARARDGAGLAADDDGHDRQRHAVARARRRGPGARGLGGQPR